MLNCLVACSDFGQNSADYRLQMRKRFCIPKKSVVFFEVLLSHAAIPPAHLLVGRHGDDEQIENHFGIAEAFFEVLYRLVEANLRIVRTLKIADALGINKRHVLAVGNEQPKDEVRIEITCFKKPDAFPATLISKQIEFCALEEALPAMDQPEINKKSRSPSLSATGRTSIRSPLMWISGSYR